MTHLQLSTALLLLRFEVLLTVELLLRFCTSQRAIATSKAMQEVTNACQTLRRYIFNSKCTLSYKCYMHSTCPQIHSLTIIPLMAIATIIATPIEQLHKESRLLSSALYRYVASTLFKVRTVGVLVTLSGELLQY